ncbi:MAG: ATP-binding protein [Anaerolineae bacterium]|nr:ATP-binding protein [Anaerolineae bacterium]
MDDLLRENPSISSSLEADESPTLCSICGREPLCENMGVIRYDVEVNDPRFGKLYRCPNNPVDQDTERHERLRRLSNLGDFADKTFYNFVVDENKLKNLEYLSLRSAFNFASEYAQNPEGWLLLEGSYGCGKTHLAAAVGNYRLQQGDMVLFITVPDLLDHMRSSFAPNSEASYDETFERIRNAPFLILDDLGTENASAWAREKMFQLFNHRYNKRLPTVVTTNLKLETLDPRIQSRLVDVSLSKHCHIAAPDYRLKYSLQQNTLSDLDLYSELSFKNFDVKGKRTNDESNKLKNIYEIAKKYVDQPNGWLVFSGPSGCGKTHIAAAIANALNNQGIEVMFVTVPDLLDYLRVTFNPDSPVTFDERFQMVRNTPFLVLDNFSTEGTTWAKEKLFQIIDYRYITRRPTLFTTTTKVDRMEARFRSRLMDKRSCAEIEFDVSPYTSLNKRP